MSPKATNTGRRQETRGGARMVPVGNPGDPSYREKRERNNEAVKKSRIKAKQKTEEMEKKVDNLKNENKDLQTKIDNLQGELGFLKDMFIKHAGTSHSVDIDPRELEILLQDTDNAPMEHAVKMLVNKVEKPIQ